MSSFDLVQVPFGKNRLQKVKWPLGQTNFPKVFFKKAFSKSVQHSLKVIYRFTHKYMNNFAFPQKTNQLSNHETKMNYCQGFSVQDIFVKVFNPKV